MKSNAQKKATAKWDAKNMARLQCKIRRDVAERFKSLCHQQGTTPNAVLKNTVEEYIKQNSGHS